MNMLNSIAIGCAIALGLLVAGMLLLAFRHPIIAKWGIRNIPRRPLQSLLIMIGLTLSTIIFAAALSLGDSLNQSIRRQVVEAYGHIDQVVVPPFLLSLIQEVGDVSVELGVGDVEDSGIVSLLTGLAEGDVNSLQDLALDGLPGIEQQHYQDLRTQLIDEPLVDGVAAAIFFPTIIRNLHSGQGEPLGLLFAVDEAYETEFGLHDMNNSPVRIADLQPGMGNVFPFVVGNTINLYAQVLGFIQDITAGDGTQPENIETAVGALVALGSLLWEINGETFTLSELRVDLATLEEMGFDTSLLHEAGLSELSLEALGIDDDDPVLEALGLSPDDTITVPSLTDLGLELPNITNGNVFSQFNLATLGQDTDRFLARFGMQMHQGDVYLSALGAEQLDAQVGDQLEIFIGPIPVSYRVRGIIREAGPLGVLLPVVMMDIAEAQQLLFMTERINAILISNQGDRLSGIQHTNTVNQRLRGYALNEQQFDRLQRLLTTPDVASVLQAAAPRARNPFTQEGDNTDLPEFVATFVDDLIGSTNFERDMEVLIRFITETAWAQPASISVPEQLPLQIALSNPAVRSWLQELPLATDDARELANILQSIDEFLVLSPLSKRLALQGADIAGVSFGTLFSISGTLSVLAGVILIFLIFVMLAAERRRELGVMRAVGLRRGHLVHMFVTEGLVYDLAAALIGLGLGLLVAFSMLGFLSGFFYDVNQQLGGQSTLWSLQWSVEPASIVIAYCLGVLLTWVVVTLSAWRVSRMTIVAAIQDLPSVTRSSVRARWPEIIQWGTGLALLAGGLYLFRLYQPTEQTLVLIAATIMLGGMAMCGNRVLAYTPMSALGRQQLIYTLTGIGLVVVWAVSWQEDTLEVITDQEPFLLLLSFVLSGPVIMSGAILVIMGSADLLARGILRLGGLMGTVAPAIRIAVAYPLSQRFRTGVAMLLFAMVILTVVVMTYVIRATAILAQPSEEHTGGFDLVLTPGLLSVFDPLFDLDTELQAMPEFPIANVAVMGSSSYLSVRISDVTGDSSSDAYVNYDENVLGVNAGYATQVSQVYGFTRRAEGYATDAAVWEALASRDDAAVVRGGFGIGADDTDSTQEMPLSELFLELVSEASGERRTARVQVIGVLEEGEALSYNQVQVNRQVLEYLRGQPIAPEQHYVKVAAGSNVRDTARALEKSLISHGINVQSFADRFITGQAIIRGVLQVFRGFAALGLVVGLAGLAVISSRSVVERRQQVGVLRAIGYRPLTIGLIFVLEASFIALAGIGIGVATGMVMGDRMIARFYEFATELTFPVPWLSIGVIILLTYAFALVAALLPAWQASRIFPAEALRYD